MLSLRDYQGECIEYFAAQWASGLVRVPAVLATGLGKTVIFTHPTFVDPFLNNGQRILVIAHTDELIEQAARKARRANPGRRVGIVKGQEYNQTTAEIIISSRQTLQSEKRRGQLKRIGLIVIDECHHALRTNTYGKILEYFGAFDDVSPVKVAGFTATLARGDKGKLSTVWQEPDRLFSRDILFGIRRGYLLDVRGSRVVVPELDMRNVQMSAGDYRDTDIAEELERTFAPEIVAGKYAELADSRRGIAFWPLVETAYHGAKAFNAAGIPSEVIHGQLPRLERRAMLKRLHTGDTLVIHGVSVLTEGFDEPRADVVVIARPTRSAPLYQQMVGRVLRPDLELAPEQRERALILDVVGAGGAHDLRSLIDLAPERPLHEEQSDELSLLQLDEQLIKEEQERRQGATFEFESDEYRGETAVVDFDPLGRDNTWKRTPGGTWYMSAGGDAYAFLTPSLAGDPGTLDVVLCSKHRQRKAVRGGGVIPVWARATEHVGLPLDMALSWAEEAALEYGGWGAKTLANRKAPWRKREPSEALLAKAGYRGIVVPVSEDGRVTLTAGEVSDLIDKDYACKRIDPLVEKVRAAL